MSLRVTIAVASAKSLMSLIFMRLKAMTTLENWRNLSKNYKKPQLQVVTQIIKWKSTQNDSKSKSKDRSAKCLVANTCSVLLAALATTTTNSGGGKSADSMGGPGTLSNMCMERIYSGPSIGTTREKSVV